MTKTSQINEEDFSPEQSLQLIRSMINSTQQDMSAKGIYFLVWGWLTFIACVGQFVLKNIVHYEKHYIVWWLMLLGVAVIAVGMLLMVGGRSMDPNTFNYDEVYSTLRISVAPVLIIIGLGIEIYAIFKKPKA